MHTRTTIALSLVALSTLFARGASAQEGASTWTTPPAPAPAAAPAAPAAAPQPAAAPAAPAPVAAPTAAAPAPAPAQAAAAPYAAPPPGAPPGRTANNAVFLELLGNGGLYSINYERFVGDFGIRAGFSYFAVEAESLSSRSKVSLTTFPILGNYYLGSANHKLQLGGGVLVAALSGESSSKFGTDGASGVGVAGTAVVGYRYMPSKGGFNFGAGFTPLFGSGGFLPWGGVSLGGVF
jgi:hypothetical protein